MRLQFELTGVEAAVARFEDAIDNALEDVMREAGARTAAAAKADHPYTDRTRTLTDSIEGRAPRGRFLAGTLEGAAVAGADYAEFLDNRPEYRFLQPAYESVEHQIEQIAETALETAARRAGW